MNLAKYVSWDTLISCGIGAVAAMAIGVHYGDWVIACWGFTGGQYLAYNFITLQRIDSNLQILCLRTELKKSMDEALKDLEAIRKEAARRND
jgi:hypothetical protein